MTASVGPGPKVRIIVCGNADRGDDGLGPAAVAMLRATLAPRMLARSSMCARRRSCVSRT